MGDIPLQEQWNVFYDYLHIICAVVKYSALQQSLGNTSQLVLDPSFVSRLKQTNATMNFSICAPTLSNSDYCTMYIMAIYKNIDECLLNVPRDRTRVPAPCLFFI